eukprot:TRINITY_DN6593_c0_g1_i1.p1 TRINITY_DN6593_c0_g1~~TRINITY_DN6593_c0_g1_i1.p1  ORF type:complete len:668 (+),score=78.59 TRINITY_DN6593_c0_g1_i1:29-2032(+)
MLDSENDAFPLYLLPQHVVGKNKTLLPTSFLEAQEQLEGLTDAGLRASCTYRNPGTQSDNDFEYPARFDGSCISVNIGASILTFPIQFASVITAVESTAKGYVGIQQYQAHNRCWLFAVKNVETSMPKVVQQLAASAAIIWDVLSMPENIMSISAGRTQVYCSRRAAFVRKAKSDRLVSQGSSRSFSGDSDSSCELGQVDALQGSPQCQPPIVCRLQPSPQWEYGDKTGGEPGEIEKLHWVTKFYQQTGASSAEEDCLDDPFMLPGRAASSLSVDVCAPMPEALKELKILTLLQGSKHVLNVFGLFHIPDPTTEASRWALISEYCSGCSMTAYLKANGEMIESDAKKASYGLLTGLDFLHQRSVVHRDIKLDHLLLRGHQNELVICGFGSACLLGEADACSSKVGTIGYQAPETLLHNVSREPADVFAAGVVIFCFLTLKKPFGGSTPAELTNHSTINKHVDFSRRKAFQTTSHECKQLIEELLTKNPARRLTAGQALHQRWLSEVSPAVAEKEMSFTSSTGRGVAVSGKETDLSLPSVVSFKGIAAPAASSAVPELLTQRCASPTQGSSRRSRSLIQTIRERTGNMLQRYSLRGNSIMRHGENGETFESVSPAQQTNRNALRDGGSAHRMSVRRGLSMIRSVIPTRRSPVDDRSLECRPFSSLDAD